MKIITSKGQKFDIRDKTDDEIYRMNKKDAISYKWKYLLLKSSILILFFYVFVLEYLNVRNLIRHTEPKSVQIFLGIVCCAIISILVVLSQIYDNVSFEYFHKMKLVEKYERNKELVSDLKQYPIEKIEIKNDQLFQIALTKLKKVREEGVELKLRMVDNIYCEACQKLKDVVEDTQRCC